MSISPDKILGLRLREIRQEHCLTQQQVAHRMHVPQSFVSRTETGLRHLRLTESVVYAVSIGLQPNNLLDETIQAVLQSQHSKDD